MIRPVGRELTPSDFYGSQAFRPFGKISRFQDTPNDHLEGRASVEPI